MPKQKTRASQSQSSDPVRQKAADDLHLIAASLRAEAEAVSTGRPAQPSLMELAGWAIHRAFKDGFLTGLVDLNVTVELEVRQALDDGIPLVIHKDPRSAGSPVIPDAQKTIEQFLREVEQREQAKLTPEQGNPAGAARPPLYPPVDPAEAACVVVIRVWQALAASKTDELPDPMKRLYLLGHAIQDLGFESSQTIRKAAWVCEFLGERIALRETEADTAGWLTLTQAASKIGRDAGTLSKACDRGEIRDNGEKGRARRLDPQSVTAYGRRLDEREKLEAYEKAEAESRRRKRR